MNDQVPNVEQVIAGMRDETIREQTEEVGDCPELIDVGRADTVEPAVDRGDRHAQVTRQLPALHTAGGQYAFQTLGENIGVLIHIHSHFPFFPVDLLSNSSLKRTNLPPSSSRTTVAS